MSDTFTYDVTVKAERMNELRFFWPFWTKAFVNGEVKRVRLSSSTSFELPEMAIQKLNQ